MSRSGRRPTDFSIQIEYTARTLGSRFTQLASAVRPANARRELCEIERTSAAARVTARTGLAPVRANAERRGTLTPPLRNPDARPAVARRGWLATGEAATAETTARLAIVEGFVKGRGVRREVLDSLSFATNGSARLAVQTGNASVVVAVTRVHRRAWEAENSQREDSVALFFLGLHPKAETHRSGTRKVDSRALVLRYQTLSNSPRLS